MRNNTMDIKWVWDHDGWSLSVDKVLFIPPPELYHLLTDPMTHPTKRHTTITLKYHKINPDAEAL